MFCRNCGKELVGTPEFCMSCGAKPMAGTSFCPGCGAPTTPMTEICVKCGVKVGGKAAAALGSAWMPMAAGIMDLVAGVAGVVIGIIYAVVFGFLTFFIAKLGALPGATMAILSIVSIIGGVFAMRKAAWGFALAAAICTLIAGFVGLPFAWPHIPLGIAAIIFTVLAKGQFK